MRPRFAMSRRTYRVALRWCYEYQIGFSSYLTTCYLHRQPIQGHCLTRLRCAIPILYGEFHIIETSTICHGSTSHLGFHYHSPSLRFITHSSIELQTHHVIDAHEQDTNTLNSCLYKEQRLMPISSVSPQNEFGPRSPYTRHESEPA
jgi:hypothetical protein